jgi:hypothetical protein
MGWEQRERWFYWGAPMAIGPALLFLPAFVYLVIEPRVKHAALISAVLFPTLAVLEVLGVRRLIWCCMERPFNLLTLLAFGALAILLVIAAYTGLFLAVFAGRM